MILKDKSLAVYLKMVDRWILDSRALPCDGIVSSEQQGVLVWVL